MIYYIGYYDTIENIEENRNYVLAATNKMDYIAQAMTHTGHPLCIISCCGTKNKKIYKSKYVKITDSYALKLPYTLGSANKLIRFLDRIVIKLQLLYQLIFCVTKNDTVFVYHSLGYTKTIALAKKLRKFKLVLEVEEIYGDVIGDDSVVQKELKFFKLADAYLFSTEMLHDKINHTNKPHVIIHGTYDVAPRFEPLWQDNKIHCVYAGTFDPRKGGAAAVAAAEFLPSNYHLHIIGFGSDRDKSALLATIESVSKKTECAITFDGSLSGHDYLRFLQSCHIGLSLQSPHARFNDTSFPSKVLSYMTNGLRVLSIQIPTLERSQIADLIYFYQEDTPQAIAVAIQAIDVNDEYDSYAKIATLDKEFSATLNGLLAAPFSPKW